MHAFLFQQLLLEGDAIEAITADAARGDDAVAGNDWREVAFPAGASHGAGAAGEVDTVGDLAVGGDLAWRHREDFLTDLALQFGTHHQQRQSGVVTRYFVRPEGGGGPLVLPTFDDIGRIAAVQEASTAEVAVFRDAGEEVSQRMPGLAPEDKVRRVGLGDDGHGAAFNIGGGDRIAA